MKTNLTYRLLLFLFCMALLLPCLTFTSCTDDPTAPDPGTSTTDTAITFVKDGVSEYTIVRPEYGNEITNAAVSLRTAINTATGGTVGILSDWVNRGEEVPTDTLEILVGLTNREESITAHAALKETEYIITVVGNRLVIVGYDDDCTVAAVKDFILQILGYSEGTSTYSANNLILNKEFTVKGNHIVKNYLNEHDKSSLSMYLGDKLTCEEEEILAFDEPSDFRGSKLAEDRNDDPDCIGFTATTDLSHWTVLNLPTDSFAFAIDDKFRQTIKIWVYVNDVDLIACDHDAVYDQPQTGSGTLYITFSDKQGNVGHSWQHTFYGSGWHEMELTFTCHNVAYDNLEKINYENLTTMTVWCNAKAGLELRFDDMRLCTYDNSGYTEPTAPYGGRWLTTCDYEALDGPILTEWYGAYFDLDEKTQGSSSVAIVGHKENVDHRVCIGIDDVAVDYDEDTFCFDMYISDLSLLGTDWQIRLEHNAQAAHYSVGYNILSKYAVNDKMQSTALKSGWNHFQLPLSATNINIGAAYTDTFTEDLTLTQLVFFIAGTGATEEENYLIRYDNFYIAKTSDLKAAKTELTTKK